MAYKMKVTDKGKLTYEDFIKIVEKIEQNFDENTSKYISGKCIWVMLDGMINSPYFVKTTVSDLREIIGDINIDIITDNVWDMSNIHLFSLREGTSKDFRGKIKFTPKGTLAATMRVIAKKENGNNTVGGFDKLPILQDEKFIISSCDNLYNCDENGADYDFIEKHAFRFLTNDKRFACGQDYMFTNPEAEQNYGKAIHEIICNMYEIVMSWAVCYEYKGNMFMFPMEREYIKETFKNRDAENGRRKTIASIVKSHERKGSCGVDGHLRTAEGFTIDGREFSLFIGSQDLERIFPNTEKTKKRLEKLKSNMKQIDNTRYGYIEK